ncbi:MAG: hypothetical protein ABEI32_00685, partial [Halothece sp.]
LVIEGGSMATQSYLQQYSPIALRDYYRQQILNDRAGWFLEAYNPPTTFPSMAKKGWCQYPAQPDFVYAYFRLLALGAVVTQQILQKTQPQAPVSVMDHRPVLCSLMENDIHRVIAPVAITAWLSWDEFRWHHYIPNIPTDLQYGLVENYPEAITGYAAFIGGFNRTEILNQLLQKTIAHCEGLAAREVSEQLGIQYQPALV